MIDTYVMKGLIQATQIPDYADLNTEEYLRVGSYCKNSDASVLTLSNCPVKRAFLMYVIAPISSGEDDDIGNPYDYRLRFFITYMADIVVQDVQTDSSGEYTYSTRSSLVRQGYSPDCLMYITP